jgi:hypothetical protein
VVERLMPFVLRNGQLVDKHTGEPMFIPERDGVCMPRVHSDVPEYESPASGKMITSRSQQRDDLKRHDCVLSDKPRQKFDREEYAHRKAQQAKELERRKTVQRRAV